MIVDDEKRARNREARKRYREKNPEKVKAAYDKWRKANPHKVKEYNSRKDYVKITPQLREKHTGWTQEEYDAAFAKQEGKCACCNKAPKHKNALSADHCHATGKKRALLCIRCNTVLGVLEHPDRAIWDAYLERYRE